MSELTRRRFCVLTGASILAGACGNGASGSDGGDHGVPTDLSTPLDLVNPECAINGKLYAGPTSKFAVDQSTWFACARVMVVRDAAGLYAMTSICPHEQCDVQFAPNTHDFQCPCHLSTFDFNGGLTMGPATTGLVHYLVTIDGSGNVVVDLQTNVPPSTRVAVQD
ncbi:MAG TPA: Rieske (2Fe-2S) protein [Polyangia bacterium]